MKVKMREWRYERKGMWLRRGGNNEVEKGEGEWGIWGTCEDSGGSMGELRG